MSLCLVGRTATLAIRKKGRTARIVNVVFPATWSRSTLLAYARAVHGPRDETVRIVKWHDAYVGRAGASRAPREPYLWLANPAAFADYAKGVLA